MKTYEICGQPYTQARLTVTRTLRLIRLFKGRIAEGELSALDFDAVLALLEDGDLLGGFLGCVLEGPAHIVPGDMAAETLLEVVADFLELNSGIVPKLLGSLKSITSTVTSLGVPGATAA